MTTTASNQNRVLGDGDGGQKSEFLEEYDSTGDAYGLAWRYLGVYIDNDGYGSRKVLWAAYYDPNYSGKQIGEYSYYDWENKKWDKSTCKSSSSCKKMDCHLSSTTTWELVGVYKESMEFDNDTFFEQLFKHQGVCLWNNDGNYEFMQNMRENWQGTCQKITSNVYIGTKPKSKGDMTYAVYSDQYCKRENTSKKFSKYLSSSYDWSSVFTKWNSYMTAYKVCQPCRAYSKTSNTQDEWRRGRSLIEYNDGEGEEEKNGFNCYDDAGYRNCNQCFKFETHSDMEEASADDLSTASKQGTILSIRYLDGKTYGSGTIGSSGTSSSSSSSGGSSGGSSSSVSRGYSSSSSSSGYGSSTSSSSSGYNTNPSSNYNSYNRAYNKYSSSNSSSSTWYAASLGFGLAAVAIVALVARRCNQRRRVIVTSEDIEIPSTTTGKANPPALAQPLQTC